MLFRFGTRVQVQVSRVDLDGRKIDFRLVGDGHGAVLSARSSGAKGDDFSGERGFKKSRMDAPYPSAKKGAKKTAKKGVKATAPSARTASEARPSGKRVAASKKKRR